MKTKIINFKYLGKSFLKTLLGLTVIAGSSLIPAHKSYAFPQFANDLPYCFRQGSPFWPHQHICKGGMVIGHPAHFQGGPGQFPPGPGQFPPGPGQFPPGPGQFPPPGIPGQLINQCIQHGSIFAPHHHHCPGGTIYHPAGI